MTRNSEIAVAVRRALVWSAVTAASVSVPALAQDQQGDEDAAQTVTVTGSRIVVPNLQSVSPVSSISSEEIAVTGKTSIEDIINQLPQAFASQGANVSNGSDGTATINLRGLGTNRTLVLVNGRRLGPGDPSTTTLASDINQIPVALVQRVEILTGGASSTYGADAVGGVVNFIMDTKFEGIKLTANYGFNRHHNDNPIAATVADANFALPDSNVSNGYNRDFSFVMGSNFADNRGNATFYAGYRKTNPVLQADYDYSACSLGSGDEFGCLGSGTSFPARIRTIDPVDGATTTSYTLNAAGQTVRGNASPFNFGPLNYYTRPDERYTAGAFTNFEVTDKMQAYGEFMFMKDQSLSQIAPSGVFGNVFTVPCNNPLWTAAQAQLFCGSYNLNTAQDASNTDTVGVIINRRNIEGGNRQQDLNHESYRTVIGLRGDLVEGWSYDVYGQYGTASIQNTYFNDFSIQRTGFALDVVSDPLTGAPTCRATVSGISPNCVPYNIYTQGGVSQAALGYLQIPLIARGESTERVVNASFTGDLGQYGLKIPTASAGLVVNFGAEYRSESADFQPDAAFQSGDGAGQGGSTDPVNGGFNARDLFAEARLPILEDMPGAKSLTAEAGYRYSEYSTNWNTDTYKLGLEYTPIEMFRFRASFQHAVRTPNVADLFSPISVALDGTLDPCAVGEVGVDLPQLTAAQCANTGLDPSRYGLVEANPAAQYNGLTGGNINLRPEKADTYSFGVAFQPEFLPGFRFQIDYFSIKIDDPIQNPNADFTLVLCAITGAASACNNVQRDQFGSLFQTSDGFVVDTLDNLGFFKTNGVDLDASYVLDIAAAGKLRFGFAGTYLDKFEVSPQAGIEYDCAGLYGGVCSSSTPNGAPLAEWKHKLSTTWSTPWNGLDVNLTWRYIDGVTRDLESDQPFLGAFGALATGVYATDSKLGSRSYLDLSAAMTFAERYNLRVGLNNALDKDPPLNGAGTCPSGPCSGNTWAQAYDVLGRQIFATASVQF